MVHMRGHLRQDFVEDNTFKGSFHSLPAHFTITSFFIWKTYIVKNWSSWYQEKGKSGVFSIIIKKMVVKSGGLCMMVGKSNTPKRECLPCDPLVTKWQNQIFCV